MAATLLMLYLCVGEPFVHLLLKQGHSLQIITSFIELPSTEIKLLSKALIARLIPANVANDDMAVLTLIQDDEADHLISVLQSKQSYNTIPVVSVLMDLSRSPLNIVTFISKDTTSILSDVMDDICDEDQVMAAQVIWRMVELNYEGNEDMSLIVNNGSLCDHQSQEDGPGMVLCLLLYYTRPHQIVF